MTILQCLQMYISISGHLFHIKKKFYAPSNPSILLYQLILLFKTSTSTSMLFQIRF